MNLAECWCVCVVPVCCACVLVCMLVCCWVCACWCVCCACVGVYVDVLLGVCVLVCECWCVCVLVCVGREGTGARRKQEERLELFFLQNQAWPTWWPQQLLPVTEWLL